MSYVDGAFSDRRSKRRALAALALVAAASLATGIVRNLNLDPLGRAEMAQADEPGILAARPVTDFEPEPLMQATAEPKVAPARRRKAAPQAEPASPAGEPVALAALEPASPASAATGSSDAAAVEPLHLPQLEEPQT